MPQFIYLDIYSITGFISALLIIFIFRFIKKYFKD